ncbi:predicted protein [Lichtheimia corymbifera JMRC:FSU:9682]|uniref:Uncharacterized protein n=1 Tax=Lichtheimia corymbifera JMRC:FSU:9682 TaxID=1263082 RepID=A0A068RE33_9FUNG|nr:predicted protein [Lichtheimia corymbifera JMRC:FSU:9682]
MSPPAKVVREVDLLAGGDIVKFGIGEHDRGTCTQGALGPDEQLCSIQDPHASFSGTQTRLSASLALSGSSYLTMNKHHLSYSTPLTAYAKHKGACISKLYNETWGLQSNKVARRGEAHLGCKFHDQPRRSQISQCHHQPKWIVGRPLEFFFRLWLVVTLGESEIAEPDRETSTQGALDPAAQLCSIDDPTFHCRIFSYGHLYVLHML